MRNRKIRKAPEVYQRLRAEFEKGIEWSRKQVEELALELDLFPYQVYKWNWDQRKRMAKKQS